MRQDLPPQFGERYRRGARLADGNSRARRRTEVAQLCLIQSPVGADAAADVEAKRFYLRDRIPRVFGLQSTGEKQRLAASFANASADGPVVGAAGAAQFLDRCERVAGVEQHRIDERRHRRGLVDAVRPGDVDHLHQHHVRQRVAQPGQLVVRHMVHQLQVQQLGGLTQLAGQAQVSRRGTRRRIRVAHNES